jgi:CDP-diacylglycerol--serine O-phosphatidyltransferase
MNNHSEGQTVWSFVPNAMTLGNLLCGCLGLVGAFNGGEGWALYCIAIAAVLDFADGATARLLRAPSAMGRELDSLADLVSFGLLPAALLMVHARSLLPTFGMSAWPTDLHHQWPMATFPPQVETWWLLCFAAIPLASAWRLARFNLMTESASYFKGLPTPAHAILWMAFLGSLPSWPVTWLLELEAWHLAAAALGTSALLISNLPMLSLKPSETVNRFPKMPIILLGVVAVAIAWGGFLGLFVVMFLYIPFSFLILKLL